MQSLRELFRIGHGPSSSHTMGPGFACERTKKSFPEADFFRVFLQGSLAKTGKGHRTDYAIEQSLSPVPVEILFDTKSTDFPHPNTLIIEAYKKNQLLGKKTWLSVGGGAIEEWGKQCPEGCEEDAYEQDSFEDICQYCEQNNISLSDYVFSKETTDFGNYLDSVWNQMEQTIRSGLNAKGHLPGGLNVLRKANSLFQAANLARRESDKERFLLSAYAYASAEENANGELMVTAPTCGACGVLPAVLFYEKENNKVPKEEILKALAVAGLVGNIIKTKGSISGAECGCQAEIGSACSMAAAALCYIRGGSFRQIDCAAEIAMEHNLGLTCDPVNGLVQIPCIERNAMACLRAYEAATLAEYVYVEQKVKFDLVIQTMKETGRDLSGIYRETSQGGLAKYIGTQQ